MFDPVTSTVSRSMAKSLLPKAALYLLLVLVLSVSAAGSGMGRLELVAEYQAPGLEVELSGVYPHPEKDGFYFVAANMNPAYPPGQSPKLAEAYRGKLLVVEGRTGEVVETFGLVDGNYGGLAYGQGQLFIALLGDSPEILKVDPATGQPFSYRELLE